MRPLAQIVADAEAHGAIVVRSPSAYVIVIAATAPSENLDLLTLDEAKTLGRFATTRQLREAINAGELAATGKQRSRVVKRADLLAWLEARRSKPVEGPSTGVIEARMRRLARERKGAA